MELNGITSCYYPAISGYYPASETAEYTELSAGGSGDFFAELCAEWEEAAKLPAEAGVRHVTLRIGECIAQCRSYQNISQVLLWGAREA